MNLAVVGIGGAGCRIADRLLDAEASTGRTLCGGNGLAIDTGRTALDAADHVPPARQLLVGEAGAPTEESDGGEPDRGVAAAREARGEIVEAFERLDLFRVDAALVVAGLGGATGGGAGAVVLDQLRSVADQPVYALAVLPSEAEGSGPARNAARSLQSFVSTADNVVAFDNDAWCPDAGGSEGDYREANDALATRVLTLFGTGETDGDSVVEQRVDPSDVVRTLDTGGLSSIGYASMDVPPAPGGGRSRLGLPSWPGGSSRKADEPDEDGDQPDAEAIAYLARRAIRGKLTLPCAVESAERALVVRSGPSRALSGVGFEGGRHWLEEEAGMVEVLAGSSPHESATEFATAVLLSNVTSVPRIDELHEQATGG